MSLKGTVHKYGDNVDTDIIIPARYLVTTDPDELGKHCMENLDADFSARVNEGDIIVGGENFGCGSSREHAPLSIKGAGISCVIAKNFARIFFRNSINIGLPILECPSAADEAGSGDVLHCDLGSGVITNATKGTEHQAVPFSDVAQKIIGAGGLINYVKARLQAEGRAAT